LDDIHTLEFAMPKTLFTDQKTLELSNEIEEYN